MTSGPERVHLTEADLVLHYYGEMPARDESGAAAHLRSCEACRAEYVRLQRALGLLDGAALVPELPSGLERTVWARLEPALGHRNPDRLGWLLSPLPLALAAAVLVLVTGAFFAGRLMAPPGTSPGVAEEAGPSRLQELILLGDVGEHLDRSQMMLLDLVSAPPDAEVDLPVRTRAEQLVADNRLYRLAAVDMGDRVLGDLLDEMERLFTEITAARAAGGDMADLRRRVEARDLLFRLRVVASELREREKEALRRRIGPSS